MTGVQTCALPIYGFDFAHVVRIDKDDNIWVVDEMASQVIKFDPAGRVLMVLGRKPEALNIRNYEAPGEPAGRKVADRNSPYHSIKDAPAYPHRD